MSAQIDPDEFRRVVGRLTTGVTVVTTVCDGRDYAMTASAVCSVSLDPVLMLVSVERAARFHDAVVEAGVWGVSVLHADQRASAAWLSTPGRPVVGQLDRVEHHRAAHTGVALLDGSLATFELRTTQVHPAGDHAIVIGHVLSVQASAHTGDALVYYRGRFGALR